MCLTETLALTLDIRSIPGVLADPEVVHRLAGVQAGAPQQIPHLLVVDLQVAVGRVCIQW